MSWTVYYDDNCFIYINDKKNNKWFSRQFRKNKPRIWLNVTSEANLFTCDENSENYYNSNSDGQFIRTENQEFLNDSEKETLLKNSGKIPD